VGIVHAILQSKQNTHFDTTKQHFVTKPFIDDGGVAFFAHGRWPLRYGDKHSLAVVFAIADSRCFADSVWHSNRKSRLELGDHLLLSNGVRADEILE
jgi:hypothetical protein